MCGEASGALGNAGVVHVQVGYAIVTEACHDKVAKGVCNVMWLVCPVVLPWTGVVEVHVCVKEEEYAAVDAVLLEEGLYWCEGSVGRSGPRTCWRLVDEA